MNRWILFALAPGIVWGCGAGRSNEIPILESYELVEASSDKCYADFVMRNATETDFGQQPIELYAKDAAGVTIAENYTHVTLPPNSRKSDRMIFDVACGEIASVVMVEKTWRP